MFDENQEALLTARDHQTILAALRFWRTRMLSPGTPSPNRVLAEVEALIRRMEGLRVGLGPMVP